MCVCPSVCYTFVCPLGDKQFVCPGGTNISHIQWGETNIFTHREGTSVFTYMGEQTFSVVGGGVDYDINGHKEEDVSEANIFAREARKLSGRPKGIFYRRYQEPGQNLVTNS